MATIKLDGLRDKIASGEIRDHVIHPTALDGLFQLGMAAISKGSWDAIPTMVPTQLKTLWISNDLLKRTEKGEIHVYTRPTFRGFREADFQIIAMDYHHEVQIKVDGWRETTLSSLDTLSTDDSGLRCYHTDWKPDPALMDSAEVAAFCDATAACNITSPEITAHRLEVVSAFYLVSVLKTGFNVSELRVPHLKKYEEWMRCKSTCLSLEIFLATDPVGKRVLNEEPYRERFMGEVLADTPGGEVYVKVGRNLVNMLRGDTNPSEILRPEEEQKLYSCSGLSSGYAKIGAYIDLMAHKKPDLRILEVGAATGPGTQTILSSLPPSAYIHSNGENILRYGLYTVTNTSSTPANDAAEFCKDQVAGVSFAVLDLEVDPLQQGFEAHEFDLVVCSRALHTSADLTPTLQNVQTLMKPGGKLILLEATNPENLRASFVFGLLPGWWRGVEEKGKAVSVTLEVRMA